MALKQLLFLLSMSIADVAAIAVRIDQCRKQTSRLINNVVPGPVPALQPIGTKADPDLDFGNAVASGRGGLGLDATVPQSGEILAAVGIARTLLGALPNPLTIGLQPRTTIKPAGRAKYFDLNSVYFACSINTQLPVTSLGRACQVSVTGNNYKDKTVSSEDLVFGPGRLILNEMTLKKFEDFKKMKSVTIVLATGTTLDPLTLLQFDDVDFTPYYC